MLSQVTLGKGWGWEPTEDCGALKPGWSSLCRVVCSASSLAPRGTTHSLELEQGTATVAVFYF